MTPTPPEFIKKYPEFAGLADDFSDPPPGYVSDELIARNIRRNCSDNERIEAFNILLRDARVINAALAKDWIMFRDYLNRNFKDADDARHWLQKIVPIWEEELDRLKKR